MPGGWPPGTVTTVMALLFPVTSVSTIDSASPACAGSVAVKLPSAATVTDTA